MSDTIKTSMFRSIFKVITDILPKTYPFKYNDILETTINELGKTVPTVNTCGIVVSGDDGSQLRIVDTGEYINRSARLQFNVFADKQLNAIIDCENYCDIVIEALSKLNNLTVYEPESGINLLISNIRLLRGPKYVGRNGQGIPVYSIHYTLNYGKGGQ